MNKPPTAKQIDDACRAGFVVLYGERPVMGAVPHRRLEITIKDYLWVHLADDRTWHYVARDSIVITDKQLGSSEGERRKAMATGKGRPGRITHIKDKQAEKQKAADAAPPPTPAEPEPDEIAEKARERLKEGGVKLKSVEADGQMIIPGQEKKVHTAIEAQALVVERAKTAKSRANRKFNEETEILTKMMLGAGVPQQDLPDGREAFIDREPVAKVRDKKDPKNTRTQVHEDIDEDGAE